MQDEAPWSAERAAAAIAAHRGLDGAALPMLHAIQRALGWIPDGVVAMVADALNLSRAEVYGILTFYHDFRRSPPGRHVLRLCRAEACQAMGADDLAARAEARLGIGRGQGDAITLEPVYCLGLCATAPAAMLDGHPVGRLDAGRLDALIEAARR